MSSIGTTTTTKLHLTPDSGTHEFDKQVAPSAYPSASHSKKCVSRLLSEPSASTSRSRGGRVRSASAIGTVCRRVRVVRTCAIMIVHQYWSIVLVLVFLTGRRIGVALPNVVAASSRAGAHHAGGDDAGNASMPSPCSRHRARVRGYPAEDHWSVALSTRPHTRPTRPSTSRTRAGCAHARCRSCLRRAGGHG